MGLAASGVGDLPNLTGRSPFIGSRLASIRGPNRTIEEDGGGASSWRRPSGTSGRVHGFGVRSCARLPGPSRSRCLQAYRRLRYCSSQDRHRMGRGVVGGLNRLDRFRGNAHPPCALTAGSLPTSANGTRNMISLGEHPPSVVREKGQGSRLFPVAAMSA